MTPRARWTLALGVAIALATGLAVVAQPNGTSSGDSSGGPPPSSTPSSDGPPGVPTIAPPPESPPVVSGEPVPDDAEEHHGATNAVAAKAAPPKAPPAPPAPPPPPPPPVRSPTAVMQALDKVTAETLRFAVPVGRPVRYKNLVFTVKACQSTGLGGPSPQASAYVVIDSAPPGADGVAPPPPRQVFKGWMFASSPGLNPFQHPIYDAWLISCMAVVPPA